MRHFIILLIVIGIQNQVDAQKLGIGIANPNASAILELNSTAKGLLPPRMSTAQRNNIANPAAGLFVFDNDLNQLQQYNGSTWVGTAGSGLALPFAAVAATPGSAFKIDNTGTAIQGISTANSSAGIAGSNTAVSGYGVQGIHLSGFALAGQSQLGTAISGVSTGTGNALRGVSLTGYGLLTSGNLRITGGNTNPAAGAILTSTDNIGNAVWKPRSIAFKLVDVYAGDVTISDASSNNLHFNTEEYDIGSGASTVAESSPTSIGNFAAPVAGIYAFNFQVKLNTVNANNEFLQVKSQILVFSSANNTTTTAAYFAPAHDYAGNQYSSKGECHIKLLAGDRVYLNISQDQVSSDNAIINVNPKLTWFSGHLVRPL